jgi:hypothetical protein
MSASPQVRAESEKAEWRAMESTIEITESDVCVDVEKVEEWHSVAGLSLLDTSPIGETTC